MNASSEDLVKIQVPILFACEFAQMTLMWKVREPYFETQRFRTYGTIQKSV